MAWEFPVMKWMWSAIKWSANKLIDVFQWAWRNPTTSMAVGLGSVAFGWLATAVGWQRVGEWASTFGWTLVTVSASAAAFGALGEWADEVFVDHPQSTIRTFGPSLGFF